MTERQNEMRDSMQVYVSDMIALNRHILDPIERQRGDGRTQKYPQALQLVAKIEQLMHTQIAELEQHLKTIGGDPVGPVKKAVSTVTGVAAGLIDKVRGDTVSKALRDDYTALSLAAMGYTMLHTTALGRKFDDTAEMALRHLTQVTPIIVEISEIMPSLVLQELQDEGEPIDPSIEPKAVRNSQKAWSREVTEK